jgi:hypothetical protein
MKLSSRETFYSLLHHSVLSWCCSPWVQTHHVNAFVPHSFSLENRLECLKWHRNNLWQAESGFSFDPWLRLKERRLLKSVEWCRSWFVIQFSTKTRVRWFLLHETIQYLIWILSSWWIQDQEFRQPSENQSITLVSVWREEQRSFRQVISSFCRR